MARQTGNLSPERLPPVFLGGGPNRMTVSRMAKAGAIRQIAPRLYTPNLTDSPDDIIRRNLWEVVRLLFPETVIGYRTAIEYKPSPEGVVVLTGSYDRVRALPGLTIRQFKGPGPLEGDRPFLGSLHVASLPRALLECLRPSRSRKLGDRALSIEAIEEHLEKRLRLGGVRALNEIRDSARTLAPPMKASAEFDRLNGIIGALLRTNTAPLTSTVRGSGTGAWNASQRV